MKYFSRLLSVNLLCNQSCRIIYSSSILSHSITSNLNEILTNYNIFAFIFVGLHRIDYDLAICGCSFLIRFVFVNLWQKFGNIFELFIVDLTLIMRLSDKYLFCMTDMRLKKVWELFHLKFSLKVQICEALALLLVNRINGQSSWI